MFTACKEMSLHTIPALVSIDVSHMAGLQQCRLLQMRQTVRQIAELFPTAIISGRGREKVQAFVQLPELYYAGSHGLDIAGPRLQVCCWCGLLCLTRCMEATVRLQELTTSLCPGLSLATRWLNSRV